MSHKNDNPSHPWNLARLSVPSHLVRIEGTIGLCAEGYGNTYAWGFEQNNNILVARINLTLNKFAGVSIADIREGKEPYYPVDLAEAHNRGLQVEIRRGAICVLEQDGVEVALIRKQCPATVFFLETLNEHSLEAMLNLHIGP
jgi:hypothetical protein